MKVGAAQSVTAAPQMRTAAPEPWPQQAGFDLIPTLFKSTGGFTGGMRSASGLFQNRHALKLLSLARQGEDDFDTLLDLGRHAWKGDVQAQRLLTGALSTIALRSTAESDGEHIVRKFIAFGRGKHAGHRNYNLISDTLFSLAGLSQGVSISPPNDSVRAAALSFITRIAEFSKGSIAEELHFNRAEALASHTRMADLGKPEWIECLPDDLRKNIVHERHPAENKDALPSFTEALTKRTIEEWRTFMPAAINFLNQPRLIDDEIGTADNYNRMMRDNPEAWVKTRRILVDAFLAAAEEHGLRTSPECEFAEHLMTGDAQLLEAGLKQLARLARTNTQAFSALATFVYVDYEVALSRIKEFTVHDLKNLLRMDPLLFDHLDYLYSEYDLDTVETVLMTIDFGNDFDIERYSNVANHLAILGNQWARQAVKNLPDKD